MSKYKCDCGGKLILIQERTYEESSKILSDGKLSKKKNLRDVGVNGASWLQCIECDKEYEYGMLENDKVDKMEERL